MSKSLSLLLLTASLAWGCAPGKSPDGRPNILLVSLDTLRGDSLGCYGYDRDTTPFLDQLAAGGVRFAHAYANTLATLPSHTTLLSSQYQESHGVLWNSHLAETDDTTIRLPGSIPWLPETLAAAGYETLAVTDGGNIAQRHGFDRGFDEFHGRRAKGIAKGIDSLLDMLDRHRDSGKPLFVFFHTYEIHAPYDPPPPYDTIFGEEPGSRFVPTAEALREVIDTAGEELSEADFGAIRRLYDGGIRFTDESLRGLWAELDRRGFFARDYLVVVLSDHGEEFGEHGGVLHRGLLYEELLHVPLILNGERLPGGEVRRDLVSLVDVAPTILDYAGVEVPEAMQGESLLAPVESRPDHVVAQFHNRRYALHRGDWKLILTGRRPVLYDLASDPGETTNVAFQNRERAQEMRRFLDQWREAQAGNRPETEHGDEPTPEEREDLRALGYVN